MITIKTEIKKNKVTYSWNKKLVAVRGKKLHFMFESDISGIPYHLFNFMFGVFMMDPIVFTGDYLEFNDLTEDEELHLNNILRLNHDSKGCGGRSQNDISPRIYAKSQSEASPPSHDNEIICANGMGKDGLNVALLTKEMGYSPFCFTIINQYWRNRKIWPERHASITKFYKEENIEHTFIETNFWKIKKKDFGFYPYVVGLPLAYLRNTNVILDGIQIHNNKTRISDDSFYCPGETYIVFNQVTEATKITMSSPLRGLSNYGSQKLLAERWPQHLKYQRSCMYGFPWCGQCSKCNRKALYLEDLGIDYLSLGLPKYSHEKLKLDSYGPVNDSVRKIISKLKGYPYNNWIEGANEYALELIWNGDKIRDILSEENYHIYSEDPGPDGDGYTLEPSKWRDIKDAQPTI